MAPTEPVREPQVEVFFPCEICGGTGSTPLQPPEQPLPGRAGATCKNCDGSGAIKQLVSLSTLAGLMFEKR